MSRWRGWRDRQPNKRIRKAAAASSAAPAPSALEESFALAWRALASDSPAPVREHRFATLRHWRFDFAWPAERVAVELDGGALYLNPDGTVRQAGRHVRPAGQARDLDKRNAAAIDGWIVLVFTRVHLLDPAACVELVRRALMVRAKKVNC